MTARSSSKNKITNLVILLFLIIFISFRVSTACNQIKKEGNSDNRVLFNGSSEVTYLQAADRTLWPKIRIHY